MALDRSSRNRLTAHTAEHFPSNSLFDRVARALCSAGRLPRKELYESWAVARKLRRRLRGGRIVDLAAGHSLLGQLLLLLDPTATGALCVDRALPPSAAAVTAALAAAFPQLGGRVERRAAAAEDVALEATDLVVALHACGTLTDVVLERAAAARARVAVLPCCHNLALGDRGGLDGWLDGALALDVTRAARLRAHGYRVWTHIIDPDITPKNRLLVGAPE